MRYYDRETRHISGGSGAISFSNIKHLAGDTSTNVDVVEIHRRLKRLQATNNVRTDSSISVVKWLWLTMILWKNKSLKHCAFHVRVQQKQWNTKHGTDIGPKTALQTSCMCLPHYQDSTEILSSFCSAAGPLGLHLMGQVKTTESGLWLLPCCCIC